MAKSNITPEQLAKVAAMVAAQKAKSDAQKNTKKALKPAAGAKPSKPTKDMDAEKAAKQAERDARKAVRDQERAVKKAEQDVKRAAKKAERDAAKAAKEAAKETKAPSWQRKIERLQAALPTATDNLTALASTLNDFSDVELTSALAFIEFERRVRGIRATAALKAGEGQTLNVGDKVLINNCNARKFIGQVGIIGLVRRVRAFVDVPGFDTQAYVWTTDVEVLEPAGAEDMGTNILDEGEESEETDESPAAATG